MARVEDIEAEVKSLLSDERFIDRQNGSIATMIAFFQGMQQGLKGKVPDDQLDQLAATLTAGYRASPD